MRLIYLLYILVHFCGFMYFSLILVGGYTVRKKYTEVLSNTYWKYYLSFACVSLLFFYSSLFVLDFQNVLLMPILAFFQYWIFLNYLEVSKSNLAEEGYMGIKTMYAQYAVTVFIAITYVTPLFNYVV